MFSTIYNYLINHLDFTISLCTSLVFLVVNIIQAVRYKDKEKLKEVISSLPEIIRIVENLSSIHEMSAIEKKASAESILMNQFGEKFIKKHIGVLDDSIEDILNTPAKKGGTYELSKKNEAR